MNSFSYHPLRAGKNSIAKYLIEKRRGKCKKHFAKLPKVSKELITLLGYDPDTLIKEGAI